MPRESRAQLIEQRVLRFNRLDAAAVALDGQREAGALGHAIDQHRAGSAHAVLAAHMGAGGAQLMTQVVTQQGPCTGLSTAAVAVVLNDHREGGVSREQFRPRLLVMVRAAVHAISKA